MPTDENAKIIVPKLVEVMKYVQELDKNDSYLIVNRNADELSDYATIAAKELGLNLEYFKIDPDKLYSDAFPEDLLKILKNDTPKGAMGLFDYSQHKDWMREELAARVNLLFNVVKNIPISWVHSPGIDMDMALNGALQCDHKKMADDSKYMLQLLEDVKSLYVNAPGKTSIEIEIPSEFKWYTDCKIVPPGPKGEIGVFGNMPVGEIWTEERKNISVVDKDKGTVIANDYPIQLIANGELVCDVCVGMYNGKLTENQNLVVEFKDGKVSRTYCKDTPFGDNIFGQWEKVMTRYDMPNVLEEVGIGFNDKARPTGNMLESEKMGKTMHLAVGNIGLHVDT